MTSRRYKPRANGPAKPLELDLTTLPAPPPPPPEPVPLAVSEVCSLPPYMFGDLPAAMTLTCALAISRETFFVTTSRARYETLRASGEVVLSGGELGALALAAESGRASRLWLAEWLAGKQVDPTKRLDANAATGGLTAVATAKRWSLGTVALHWGFIVKAAEVEG